METSSELTFWSTFPTDALVFVSLCAAAASLLRHLYHLADLFQLFPVAD